MKNISLTFFVLISFPIISLAQTSPSDTSKTIFESGAYQVKLKYAQQQYYGGEYKAALSLYKELIPINSKDAVLYYRIGECYLALNDFSQSIENFLKARNMNPAVNKELSFVLGQAYHKYGKFDEAITEFEGFKKITKEKKEEHKEANRFISQCKVAKDLTSKPLKAEIMNLGGNINSQYDDYAPSVTANGKTMIFTSRRSNTTGGMMDEYDGKFYEDIYIVNWDEEKKAWAVAASIPGKLNTEFHDANLSISPDGSQIFVYRNIPNETRSGDIFVSKLNTAGNWNQPKPLTETVNSSYFESSASLSADGNYLYFASERKGGFGQADIYRSQRISSNEWSEPENLGAAINSSEDEISVFIHPDGKTLYFSSASSKSMGGLDIFKSVLEDGKWSEPENLGYPINTLGDDLHFVMTADNNMAYYSSVKPGGMGERDIYSVNFKKLNKEDKKESADKGLSIIKGNVKMVGTGQTLEVELEFFEPNNGPKVASTNSNPEGQYFITLPGDKEYEVSLRLKGCKSIREKLRLPLDAEGTFILVKHFLVEKAQE